MTAECAAHMCETANLRLAPPGKLLALDPGLARIGIAVCDPLQLRARPHSILERTSRNRDFEWLADVVRTEEAQAVICGLPLNMDGSDGDQARRVRKWALRLAYALRALLGYPVPIIFWDERLSTSAVDVYAHVQNEFAGEHAVAAALILQRYLDREATDAGQDLGQVVLPAWDAQSESP